LLHCSVDCFSRAKLLLRKKRLQEQLLGRADGALDNLERLVHDLEFSQVEMQVLDGLRTGNEALNKIHQVLSIDEVERIMDDTREAVEKQKVFFPSHFSHQNSFHFSFIGFQNLMSRFDNKLAGMQVFWFCFIQSDL